MATFKINTVNNYASLNQAKIININNAINNDVTLDDELKTLLIQLQTTIASSALSDQDKWQAIIATQTLAEASKKNQESEQKNLIGNTLDYFKKLSNDLDGFSETAIKLGEAVAKITLWFGI